jgi:hypothetical protein
MDPVTLALAGPQISAKSTSHQDLHLSYLHWMTPTTSPKIIMKKALLIQTIIAGTITTHIMALLDEQQQPTKGKDQMVQAV